MPPCAAVLLLAPLAIDPGSQWRPSVEIDPRIFVDWALGAKAQALVVKAGRAYPANGAAASSPLAPKWSEIKFTDYDIAKYEKSAMRRKLTERWTAEIGSQAQ